MSISSLEAPPTMPTMVSRLPKFGFQAKSSAHAAPAASADMTSTRLTNGFYHHPGPAGVNGAGGGSSPSAKQNGFLRAPASFATNFAQQSTRTAAGKGRVLNHPVTPQPATKDSSKLQTAPNLANGTKQAPSRPWTGRGGSLRRPQSFARPPGSPLQKTQASRSHSSDDLGSAPPAPLTQNDRFRSQSLNQVRRQASPTLSSSSSSSSVTPTRSYLFSKSRLKPTPSPQARAGSGVPSLPPASLKKPLLPSVGPSSKSSGVSYKLTRPSLNKQPRPLRVTPARASQEQEVKTVSETPPTTGNSQSEGTTPDTMTQKEGGTLDDMSTSSSSSLDTNHTSQEYMDDFDNLGNGSVGILHLSVDDYGLDQKVSKVTRLCFMDDGTECGDARLPGEQRERHLLQLPPRRRSGLEDHDHDQGGSSLDLSPSDSCGSGGIYMWDEEGLEHLGGLAGTPGSNTTHHIGSFDSDLNSVDVLNHLDSCDLDDDDLMLDGDDSDGSSLFSDGDGSSHLAEWTRRQLCWGTQDFDNHSERSLKLNDPRKKKQDNETLLDFCPRGSDGLGADVEELAEDCCAVRSQLEHLQRLLLQDEDVNEDTLSPEDSSGTCDSQVQALLEEVQQLREELRSRDQTIAHLTLQLAVPTATSRCRCQQTKGRVDRHTQTSTTERERTTSQTPRRDNHYQRSRPYRGRAKPGVPPHLSEKTPDTSPPQPSRPGPSDAPKLRPASSRKAEPQNPQRSQAAMLRREGEGANANTNTRQLQPPSMLRLFLSQKSPDPERKGSSRLPKPKT